MTCSTNRRKRGSWQALLLAALAVALGTSAAPPAAPATPREQRSQLLTTLPLPAQTRPKWGRFSADARHVLLDVDGRGVLVALPPAAPSLRRLRAELSPVGWLGPALVARRRDGRYLRLDPQRLQPARAAVDGWVTLPWTLGHARRVHLSTAPTRREVVAREAAAAFTLSRDGRQVLDSDGQVVLDSPRPMQSVVADPAGRRLLLYFGNSEHVLFDRESGRRTPLPAQIHAWHWFAHGRALLGEVSLSSGRDAEEVQATQLYVYSLANRTVADAALAPVRLPRSLQGAALDVLDVAETRLLLSVEHVGPQPPRTLVLTLPP